MPRHLPNLPRLAGLGIVALALAAWLLPKFRQAETSPAPPPVLRGELVLQDGLLHRRDRPEPFTGVMIERYPDGPLQSRSEVRAGRLDGLSEGWYPAGQLQIREHFHAGVSDGLRTKWRPNGRKLSEANVVQGRLQGTFRRWHENGVLAEEVEMRDGKPDGAARAWYPSGFLRSRVVTRDGRVAESQTWSDGERREDSAGLETEDRPS